MLSRVPDDRHDRGRAWCFTSFSEQEVGEIKSTPGVVAMCVGEEIAPETGKVHYQGYVRFRQPKRFSWWKLAFPKLHVEIRVSTESKAAEYCRKDGNVLVDFGCDVGESFGGDVVEEILDMLDQNAPLAQVRKHNRRYFYFNAFKIKAYKEQIQKEFAGIDE